MSVARTQAVMERYFNSDHSDTDMMADDVVFTSMADGSTYETPQGVLGMLDFFYHVAFEADAETRSLVFGEDHAVWEGMFKGTHKGEFAGVPATGKEVEVPLCVIYDIQDDQITAGRIYFEIPVFLRQVGAM